MAKIVLNQLPPAHPFNPTAGLNVLKGFLNQNHITTSIQYWNFQLNLVNNPDPREDLFINLLPFLFSLSKEYKCERSRNEILSYMQSLDPTKLMTLPDIKSNEEFLEYKLYEFNKIIDYKIDNLDFDDNLLLGFTYMFYQWIPAITIIKKIKEKYPNKLILIGGFRQKQVAESLLKTFPFYDFAIWGEGELPLLKLVEQIESKTENYNNIPQLIYRKDDKVTISTFVKSEYQDLSNYNYPEFDEYYSEVMKLDKIEQPVWAPLDTIRGCDWNKCKFCFRPQNYKYRERQPKDIISQIELLVKKYSITTFRFCDENSIGKDINRFEELLDLIIESSKRLQIKYYFEASINTSKLNANLLEKIIKAGFVSIVIGYEAHCDSLLNKVNKNISFSDHIFMLKYFSNKDVNLINWVIMNLPDETEEDIFESINNLYYLRFSLTSQIYLNYIPLQIGYGSVYYNNKEDKENWFKDDISRCIPNDLFSAEDQEVVFIYNRIPTKRIGLWEKLKKTEEKYRNLNYNYKIVKQDSFYIINEYIKEDIICQNKLSKIQWDILDIANDQVVNINYLFDKMFKLYENITVQDIENNICELRKKFLLYQSKNNRLISIINTKMLQEYN